MQKLDTFMSELDTYQTIIVDDYSMRSVTCKK